jgi:Putative Flp pilus-assembly TadE/G-like
VTEHELFLFGRRRAAFGRKPAAERWRLGITMPPDFVGLLCSAIARIFRDKTGATATIVAIALPGLIGMSALGVETGVWFTIKLQNQSAADSAAISAAYEVIAGKTNVTGELAAAADEAARRNGYKGSVPAVVTPYNDGIVANGIVVTLQQSQRALLAAIFLSDVTIANTAVAVIEVLNHPCILALGRNSTDVEIAASTRLDMPNCSVAANSISSTAIELRGSTSSVAAATLVTGGEISLQGIPINPAAPPPQFALSSPAMIGAPSVTDPYAGTLTHAFLIAGMPTTPDCIEKTSGHVTIYSGNCTIPEKSLTGPQILLSANTRISGSWRITSGQMVDLSPGTYWVTGSLTLQSDAVLKCSTCDNTKGAGVTIILTGQTSKIGAVSVASNATLTLNAPKSGRFAGLAIIQDSHGLPPGTTYTSSQSTIGGTPGATLSGLVYFPNSSMTFHGAPSATGPQCLLLVVKTLDIDAASRLEAGGCASAGLGNLPAIDTVAVAE